MASLLSTIEIRLHAPGLIQQQPPRKVKPAPGRSVQLALLPKNSRYFMFTCKLPWNFDCSDVSDILFNIYIDDEPYSNFLWQVDNEGKRVILVTHLPRWDSDEETWSEDIFPLEFGERGQKVRFELTSIWKSTNDHGAPCTVHGDEYDHKFYLKRNDDVPPTVWPGEPGYKNQQEEGIEQEQHIKQEKGIKQESGAKLKRRIKLEEEEDNGLSHNSRDVIAASMPNKRRRLDTDGRASNPAVFRSSTNPPTSNASTAAPTARSSRLITSGSRASAGPSDNHVHAERADLFRRPAPNNAVKTNRRPQPRKTTTLSDGIDSMPPDVVASRPAREIKFRSPTSHLYHGPRGASRGASSASPNARSMYRDGYTAPLSPTERRLYEAQDRRRAALLGLKGQEAPCDAPSQQANRALASYQRADRAPASSQQANRAPASSQRVNRMPAPSQQGNRTPASSQQGNRLSASSQRANRAPAPSQQANRAPAVPLSFASIMASAARGSGI